MRNVYKLLFFLTVFSVTVITGSGQITIFFDNCNALGGWTNTGGRYQAGTNALINSGAPYLWSSVDPLVPPDDHTIGGNCFYTNGNVNYVEAGAGHYILYRLQSPAINLTGYNNTRLEFWMQLRSETGNWDGAFVEVSTNGTTWTQLTPPQLCVAYDGNMSQNASSTPFYPYLRPAWWNYRTTWTRVMADISAYDNVPTFYVRFTFHSDEAALEKGWTIDDIRVVSVAAAQVQGNNIVIADNDLTPAVADFTDFGAVPIGSSLTHTFYIHNTGESDLTLTGTPYVTVTGAGFTVLNQPATNIVPAGGSVPFDVQFTPTTVGTINGTVNIPNSDNFSTCNPPNPYNFAIRGRNLNTPPFATTWINDTMICPNSGPVTFNYVINDIEQNVNTITVTATSSNPAIVPAANITTGGTGANRNLNITPVAGSIGSTTISVTLNDGQTVNNDSIFSFVLTMDDTLDPVAVCQNMTVQLDANGNGSLTATQVDNGSTDNCGIQSISLSQSQFTCADVGTVTVDFIVEDIAGNISTCPFQVDVLSVPFVVTATTSDYNGYEVSCTNGSDGTILVSPTGGCAPFTYSWTHDPTNSTGQANALATGTYTVVVTDVAGQTQQLSVTLDEPPLLVNTSTFVNISCFGESDGEVHLQVTGGVQPYQYSLGPDITGLSANTYNYTISDANTCQVPVSITITEPPPIDLSGIDYFSIFCGENVTFDITSGGGTGNLSFSWDHAEYLDCPTCEDPVASPDKSTVFIITATDDRGCKEVFSVTVEADCNVFIPNSFTPNSDGNNEAFVVVAGGARFFEMRIFNRWGQEIFVSNDINTGWTGVYHNEPVPAGIYVYDVHIVMPNGDERNVKGHVSLLR